ncbi:PTS sugar transporter subunit IIB [Olsenella sp. HMSC062G07]|uniref:PTS system mannose/fructose/N-acetylgalactosamine-transporter subunit IIB n=1 Tax=Olsenella sp. HMSC062G07 TaxID=1739330 RepID=UPI0008A13372|nr:PTS sugar transporter subunit IIB [Olsenella sp. HMSC062G07]OFK23671.1 PTS sugar transporter [Olsenella sp. HMSC062G07]
MAKKIVHARVDYRLIHGQVITKWLKQCGATKIIIIDDKLSKDEFLSAVYKMAAPTGIEVDIISVATASSKWETDSFYGDAPILLLFKTVEMAKAVVEAGIRFSELQVGGLENKPGRKIVHNQISLDSEDANKLASIDALGIRVYFQTVPGEEPESLEKVSAKLA